jgi:membrane-associated phospholipid phosphatase
LYAKLGMSLTDVAIAVWNSKYIYNIERPIQFIRRNPDRNRETVMNHPITGIRSYTPEFPAYPSGHSGFGGAAAPVLAEYFGYNYSMTDKCHQYRVEFRGTPVPTILSRKWLLKMPIREFRWVYTSEWIVMKA